MQYYTLSFTLRNSQQGSSGEGAFGAGPRFDLPLSCYLLLWHKGTPRRAASDRKARRRMSQPELHREEGPLLSSMTTLSSMNTIYTTGSLFSNRPPSLTSSLSPLSEESFLSSVFRRPFLSLILVFFYRANQERCSPSIANWLKIWTFITWQLGICVAERHKNGSVLCRGMWAQSQGHHYNRTLSQSHEDGDLRFTQEFVKKTWTNDEHNYIKSCKPIQNGQLLWRFYFSWKLCQCQNDVNTWIQKVFCCWHLNIQGY